jgi:hypothetical protein
MKKCVAVALKVSVEFIDAHQNYDETKYPNRLEYWIWVLGDLLEYDKQQGVK